MSAVTAEQVPEALALEKAGVRVTPDRCLLSVIDIIEQRKTKHAWQELRRLKKKYPELLDVLQTWHFRGRGRGQSETPVIAARHVPYFLQILHSRSKLCSRPPLKPSPPKLKLVNPSQPDLGLQPLWPPGPPSPYGWRWGPGRDLLIPDRAEHAVIRYIRQLRAFGFKLGEIADQLRKDGIKPRGGERWRKGDLHELLEFDHKPLEARWRNLMSKQFTGPGGKKGGQRG